MDDRKEQRDVRQPHGELAIEEVQRVRGQIGHGRVGVVERWATHGRRVAAVRPIGVVRPRRLPPPQLYRQLGARRAGERIARLREDPPVDGSGVELGGGRGPRIGRRASRKEGDRARLDHALRVGEVADLVRALERRERDDPRQRLDRGDHEQREQHRARPCTPAPARARGLGSMPAALEVSSRDKVDIRGVLTLEGGPSPASRWAAGAALRQVGARYRFGKCHALTVSIAGPVPFRRHASYAEVSAGPLPHPRDRARTVTSRHSDSRSS